MDLMAVRRSIMQGRRLPPGYQRVEYVSGTGTQYIDTGIECTSDLCVDYEFLVPTMENLAICGGIAMVAPIFRHHASPYDFQPGAYMYALSEAQESFPVTIPSPQINTRYHVYVDPVSGDYTFEGDNYFVSSTATYRLPQRTTGRSYGILGRISNTGAIQGRKSQFYWFKFRRGGKLIGDFIPCYRKSDNVPGMYDLVTNVFFTNAGTGTIGVGPDV